MSRNAYSLVGAQGEVIGRTGKLKHIYISTTGDRIWNLREVDVNGNVIYKISCGVDIPHTELDLGFRDALFAEVVSGTTGEINVLFE